MKEIIIFLKSFLFGYIRNTKTKEIHRVSTLTGKCLAGHYCSAFKTNMRDTNFFVAKFLLKYRGYNGCFYCYHEKDTDHIKNTKP